MPPLLHHAALVALAAAVGFVWGLSEIVGMFKFDTGHALRTRGAWLLLLINAAASGGVYLFLAGLIPGLDQWHAALLIGLAWPTVIRNANIKLAGSLDPNAEQGAAIRLEQIYANFQGLARRLINAALARQRVQLVLQATQFDLKALEHHARLLQKAAPLGDQAKAQASAQTDAQADAPANTNVNYIDLILQSNADDEAKKVALAVYIIENFGREALEEFMRRQRSQRRPAPSASP